MAKTGKFKCLKCKRRFKMAAHLGRHMSTVHAAKAEPARKKAAKRAVKRKVRRRKAARWPAVGVAASLIGQLRRCQRELVGSREALSARIAALDDALAALGGGVPTRKPGPARGRRPAKGPRPGSLKDFIGRVLRARRGPTSVKDITAGVLKAGFKTKNKTLDNSVGVALADMKNVVKVARGIYRLK